MKKYYFITMQAINAHTKEISLWSFVIDVSPMDYVLGLRKRAKEGLGFPWASAMGVIFGMEISEEDFNKYLPLFS